MKQMLIVVLYVMLVYQYVNEILAYHSVKCEWKISYTQKRI